MRISGFRFGYDYLIEPMMAIGGYTAVSERMGIALNERTLKDREYYEIRGMKLTPQKVEIDGFLTLGRQVLSISSYCG